MPTCNFIVIWKRQVECGKPATHSLPPLHRLILCAEHAKDMRCTPGPEPLTASPPAPDGEGGAGK